jgi:hypothetical protein
VLTIDERAQDRQRVRDIQRLMQIFLKAGKTLRLYSEEHRYFDQFTDDFCARMGEQLARDESLTLEITPNAIQWEGHVVFENQEQRENLAYKLYRDGVRLLQFRRGVEPPEIREFVTMIAREVDSGGGSTQDLSVLFWEAEFKHIHLSVAQTFVQHTDESRRLYKDLEEAAQEARRQMLGDGELDDLPAHEPSAWEVEALLDGPGTSDGGGADVETEFPDIPRDALDDALVDHVLADLHGLEDAYASFEEVGAVLDRVVGDEDEADALRDFLSHLDEAISPLLATAAIGPVNAVLRRLSLRTRALREQGSPLAPPLEEFFRKTAQPARLVPLARAIEQDWDDAWKGDLFTFVSIQHPAVAGELVEFLAALRREEPRHTVVDALLLLTGRSSSFWTPLLRHPTWQVAADAAWAIAKLGEAAALDQVPILASRSEPMARLAALEALKGHHSSRVQEIVVHALKDDDADVRLAALRWVAVYQAKDALPTVVATLRERAFTEKRFEEQRGWMMTWAILAPKDAWAQLRRTVEGARGHESCPDELHLAILGLKASRLPEARAFLEELARSARGDLLAVLRKALA